jgi:hypothetical protein
MGIYLKLYNFEADEKTRKPVGEVVYEVMKVGSTEKIFEFTEEIKDGSPTEVTIEKLLPLKSLAPGQYEIKMKVTDKLRNQTLTPSAKFTVT